MTKQGLINAVATWKSQHVGNVAFAQLHPDDFWSLVADLTNNREHVNTQALVVGGIRIIANAFLPPQYAGLLDDAAMILGTIDFSGVSPAVVAAPPDVVSKS